MYDLLTDADRGGTGGVGVLDRVGFDDPDHWDEAANELIVSARTGDVGGAVEPEVQATHIEATRTDEQAQKAGATIMFFERQYTNKLYRAVNVGRKMFGVNVNRGIFSSDLGTNYVMPERID